MGAEVTCGQSLGCPFEYDDSDVEMDDSENGENPRPNVNRIHIRIYRLWMTRFANATGDCEERHSGSAERSQASRFLVARNMTGLKS